MLTVAWLLICVIFVVIEIVSMGLTSIWFAFGALAAAIVAACKLNIWVQILVFMVVSIALFAATRKFVNTRLLKKLEKTNVEGIVGKKVLVVQEINNQKSEGQVKLNDLEWSARSVDDSIIPEGVMVIVEEVQGVKLMVRTTSDNIEA